jgi:hypothetical protein
LDNWCPLFQIANEIGGKWPARAQWAALSLSGQDDTPTVRTELLDALAKIYREAVLEPDGFLKTAFIVEELNKDKEAPWSDWKNGMTAHRLGKLLREFKVKSKRPRHGGPKESGYYWADIRAHCEAYGTEPAETPKNDAEAAQEDVTC